ncbi:MAG TPA: DUF1993 domain-containing protein [Acetobacteraceae bacterium]|jgi:hypothetical protein|nr:DUF1993 domain-containing protein [Acetobacteraceae bacterium]
MPLSMYEVCVPVCLQALGGLSAVLEKAETHCRSGGADAAKLVEARLAPDMFTLAKQVQIACDFARWAVVRTAGLPVERTADTEKTLAELRARVAGTIAFLKEAAPEQLNGREESTVTFKGGEREFTFTGKSYLLHFALPNLYFHVTAAYAILRHNGVVIGKRDFLGAPPTP